MLMSNGALSTGLVVACHALSTGLVVACPALSTGLVVACHASLRALQLCHMPRTVERAQGSGFRVGAWFSTTVQIMWFS